MLSRLSLSVFLATRLMGGEMVPQADEYRVKAAFLCNFASFVEWPAEAFHDADGPFTICVLGKDPFGRALNEVLAGKKIVGRAPAIRLLPDARQIAGCHILFISPLTGKQAFAGLAASTPPGVLTVGEAGDAGSEGVIIKFTLDQGRVRFEINLGPAEDGKLHLSSRLLSLATVVRKPLHQRAAVPPP